MTERFSFPTTIHFGAGARKLVAPHLLAQGIKRPLLVTDRGIAGLPLLKAFLAELAGLDVGVFSDISGNPVRSQVMLGADAYRAHQPMPYDAETSAMAAVLTAIRPKENYFKMSESGTVSAGLDGRTSFTASAGGKHQYLIFDPAQKDKILQTYIELASAKPVVRAPRFRQQKKQEPAKPVVEKLVDPLKP